MEKFKLKQLQRKDDNTKPNRKVKVMFYSNSPQTPTGYARVGREIVKHLAKDERFDVSYLGENYTGQPQIIYDNVKLYGVQPGIPPNKLAENYLHVVNQIKPDITILLEDSFTLKNQGFLQTAGMKPFKQVMYLPLDGRWIPTTGVNILRLMDHIVAMSKATQDYLADEKFGSTLIYHGVDLNLFQPVTEEEKIKLRQKYGLPIDKFLIFNYGRNSHRKNNQKMLHIVAKALEQLPDAIAFFHLMNYNAEDLNVPDYIQRLLATEFDDSVLKRIMLSSKGLDPNNAASDEEVADYVKMSDLVITASTGEGFGLIMPEAMACKKPIISTDYTTPYELLHEPTQHNIGPRGSLIEPETLFVSSFNTEHAHVKEEPFVEEIIKLYNDEETRKMYGENGRQFVEEYCDWNKIGEQWKELIFKLI